MSVNATCYLLLAGDFLALRGHLNFQNAAAWKKIISIWVLTLKVQRKSDFIKNRLPYMHMNAWSFSLYRSLLHCIFTHINLLFSTPAFSLYEKLLCFVRNVPDKVDEVCTSLSLQYDTYVSDFTTFYLLHSKSRKTIWSFIIALNASFLVKRQKSSLCC